MVAEVEEAVGVPLSREPDKLEEARTKLDAGLGLELFVKYRAKERSWNPLWWLYSYMFDPRYETLILGAYMMHVGAKITPGDRQHLKEILPKVRCGNAYALPFNDGGFRDPGRVQYNAALEAYVDGHPKTFLEDR